MKKVNLVNEKKITIFDSYCRLLSSYVYSRLFSFTFYFLAFSDLENNEGKLSQLYKTLEGKQMEIEK